MAKNEFVSLAFLSIKPMHTYAIGKLIDETQIECWAKISRASLYAAFSKLVKSGDVSVEMVSSDKYPSRKVFSITDKGKARFRLELEKALSDTTEINSVIFYLAINFFFAASREEGLEWSERRRQFLLECKEQIVQVINGYKTLEYHAPVISVEAILGNVDVALQGVGKFQALLKNSDDYYTDFEEKYRVYLEAFEDK